MQFQRFLQLSAMNNYEFWKVEGTFFQQPNRQLLPYQIKIQQLLKKYRHLYDLAHNKWCLMLLQEICKHYSLGQVQTFCHSFHMWETAIQTRTMLDHLNTYKLLLQCILPD